MADPNTNTIPTPIAPVRVQHPIGEVVVQSGKKFRVSSYDNAGRPILDMLPQSQQGVHRGRWLANKMAGLYQDKDFQRATPEQQSFYKQRAYERWIVPYYKHIGTPAPSLEQFLDPQKNSRDELQSAKFWEKAHNQDWRNFFTGVKVADKTISSISNLLSLTAKFITSGANLGFKDNAVSRAMDVSTNYYDKQAQDMEDQIQDLGGHNLVTNMSSLVAQASMFEATGASKAASFIKLANPQTASFAIKLLKTEWNSAVTGLFWGASTGTKPADLHEDVASFMALGVAERLSGGLGSRLMKFLGTFGKSAPREVVQQTIKDAADGLLKDGVPMPKQAGFNVENYQDNKKAATSGIAKTLNEMASLKTTKKVLGAKDVNGAFKKLSPQQQKEVVTRLWMMLSQSQDTSSYKLAEQMGSSYIKETEENALKVVPKVAKEVQESTNGFIRSRIPQATDEDVTYAKLGAILPHHTTTSSSPLAHVSARIAWLTNMLKDEDLIMSERDALREALVEEKSLYGKIKERSNMSRVPELRRDLAKETDSEKRADIQHAIEREEAVVRSERGPGRGKDK